MSTPDETHNATPDAVVTSHAAADVSAEWSAHSIVMDFLQYAEHDADCDCESINCPVPSECVCDCGYADALARIKLAGAAIRG